LTTIVTSDGQTDTHTLTYSIRRRPTSTLASKTFIRDLRRTTGGGGQGLSRTVPAESMIRRMKGTPSGERYSSRISSAQCSGGRSYPLGVLHDLRASSAPSRPGYSALQPALASWPAKPHPARPWRGQNSPGREFRFLSKSAEAKSYGSPAIFMDQVGKTGWS
jgi:hypothetical protein